MLSLWLVRVCRSELGFNLIENIAGLLKVVALLLLRCVVVRLLVLGLIEWLTLVVSEVVLLIILLERLLWVDRMGVVASVKVVAEGGRLGKGLEVVHV